MKRGFRRPLIVTDPGIRKLPFFSRVQEALSEVKIPIIVFNEVEPNPKDYNVQGCAELIKNEKVDSLIAIGGGSPMDCAKAASVAAVHPNLPVRALENSADWTESPLPLIAVPTTAGTGSEVTFSAVITDTANQFKFTIKSPAIAPKAALIDPKLTHTMPPLLTAATGMDALTHAIEAYTARNATPFSDACAIHAVKLINGSLLSAWETPENGAARKAVLTGSILAGIAFSNSDVAAVHCIAEALGSKYDTPHGICNAVILPVIMRYNASFCRPGYAAIASAMGFSFNNPAEGAEMAVRRVEELVKQTGLPRFREFGVKPEDIDEIAKNSAANGSNKDNARPMGEKEYRVVLQLLTESKGEFPADE